MNRNKVLHIKISLEQALAVKECLKNDITANRHILEDQHGSDESWELASKKVNIFTKLQRSISRAIKSFT